MSDDGEKAGSPAAPEVAADKPVSSSKPRKSTGGGPKKSNANENAKFEYGETVLARLRGYPPWPARITDPDHLPANVLAQRPKNPAFYCAQFFPAGDFSWLPPKEIAPLKSHQIQAFLSESHRKSQGALRDAYQTASDPTEWDEAQQAKRKALEEAEAAADEDVDELEDEEGPAVTGGKRKRAAAPAKKDAKKAKPGAKKTEDKAKPKPAAKSAKKDTKAATSSAAADDDAHSTDPEAVKVKDWRHKLQRAFLSGKSLPTAEEMEGYDELFKTIESYPHMKIEYLQFSKIGKVMKKIAALSGVPRDDEFKITTRAEKLMNDWSEFISREGEPANGKAEAPASEEKADKAHEPAAAEEKVAEETKEEEPVKESTPAAPEPTAEEIQVDA